MAREPLRPWIWGLLGVGVIWGLTLVGDRLWLQFDHTVPAWDQADYLTGTLNYWQALQDPERFSPPWFRDLWERSTKIPPLTYLVAGGWQQLWGRGPDQSLGVMGLYQGVLLGAVYGLGVRLFRPSVGLGAAAMVALLPGIYPWRLQFLLDFPLAALVTLTFLALTGWWQSGLGPGAVGGWGSWGWAIALGGSLGLALLTKQTALFFLVGPLLWTGIRALQLQPRRWVGQGFLALGMVVAIAGPWYRTNWLTILTAGKRATLDAAALEQSPPLSTGAAWTYYGQILPEQIAWPLLMVSLVGWLLALVPFSRRWIRPRLVPGETWRWLGIFLGSAYLLASANVNKDPRYVLPYLPVLCLVLAAGLEQWAGFWGARVRWGTWVVAVVMTLYQLFPLPGGDWAQVLSPAGRWHPTPAVDWFHGEAIATMIAAEPYQRHTLGVLPSTPEINQHNLNYGGALADFRVYGRQVGTDPQGVEQDGRSLAWYLTKTGDQGSLRTEEQRLAQAALHRHITQGQDFQVHGPWPLPDGSGLELWHRRSPAVEVTPMNPPAVAPMVKGEPLRLESLEIPQQVPPGQPIPVTYQWSGPWETLQQGLVLITYQPDAVDPENQGNPSPWIHDHAIGLGQLAPDISPGAPWFQVTERLATLPPPQLPAGTYHLQVDYLHRSTGAIAPITVPRRSITVDPEAPKQVAPELDGVSQLRTLAEQLPQGLPALASVFATVGRINQYDPVQDYVHQAELTLNYRLQQQPQALPWRYGQGLARVLQRDGPGAIASFEAIAQLDPANPMVNAYLGFLHLYEWQPWEARRVLAKARAIAPDSQEIRTLSGVAALFSGDLWGAWQALK